MSPDTEVASGVRAISVLPGRVRLRAVGPEGHRQLAPIAETLSASTEVASVEIRQRSASVLVHFDPTQANAVADRLLELGVDLRAGADVRSPARSAGAVTAAAAAADRSVGRLLDGTDLRTLVPLGLGLMAVRRALRGEERIADAPWYVLAWYASETFWKFHVADSEEK